MKYLRIAISSFINCILGYLLLCMIVYGNGVRTIAIIILLVTECDKDAVSKELVLAKTLLFLVLGIWHCIVNIFLSSTAIDGSFANIYKSKCYLF